ncbi:MULTISPECIES: PAS domain-containing protein [unclassified Aureimonas]|uniref:PAS domain-containing protein n=1 Tax=unclassified Aureimonas TaxID=2615206 RepID=UPI000722659D|nr:MULTISPECIES: PAS domain-containing protein [unclassified Aureimonas]ALN72452.1 hypothetical protein M673_06985 [Aureimonas sp. AU20]
MNDDSKDGAGLLDLIGIWNWQVSTNLVIACERVCEYINVPRELGQHGIALERFQAAIHPDDRSGLTRGIAAAMAGENSMTVDYRLRSILHGTRWVRSRARCFRTADGRLTYISGYLSDIAPPLRPVPDRSRKAREGSLVDHLTQARDLAASLDYDLLRALIDATLLETGYQIAARLEPKNDA